MSITKLLLREDLIMKVNIFYFSGTGNTLKVAETLKNELELLNANVCFANLENNPPYSPCDALVIAYPVWGFNSPQIVKNFVKNLPNDVANTYFLKTSGEPLSLNDASSIGLVKILDKKGYRTSGEYHYVMPYNMVFRHDDVLASKMLRVAKERLKNTAVEIRNGLVKSINYPLKARVMRAICSVEHSGMRLNGKFYSVNKNDCINCNKCLKNCPTKNITIKEGKYYFGTHCLGCARCAFNCPTNAINTGLLNFLKVNGPYDFSLNSEQVILPKYCNKSYKKYFDIEK